VQYLLIYVEFFELKDWFEVMEEIINDLYHLIDLLAVAVCDAHRKIFSIYVWAKLY
jgi:hypothetical protein